MAFNYDPPRSKVVERLVTAKELEDGLILDSFEDTDNIVKKMDDNAIAEVRTIIQDRFESARSTTDDVAARMEKYEKQYAGVFQDRTDEERVFIPKTRETVQAIEAYLLSLVHNLKPLVTFEPVTSSIMAAESEYKRAKVSEAMVNYYMENVWKIKTDLFPKWLRTFLKFPMAVWKISYLHDPFKPDLKLEVVDRAFLYVDPSAADVKDAKWVIEKYYLPRSEVKKRIEDKHWHLRDNDVSIVEGTTDDVSNSAFQRYYGSSSANNLVVREDEMIEVWEYWQAPVKGLSDAYAVMLGGEEGALVRYGKNPFPYKGIPYRAKSFSPHEYRPDGEGLVQQVTGHQEIINNYVNLRTKDVMTNIIRPVAVTGRFVDAQTMEDFKAGHKLIRLSEEVIEASREPSFDLRKHFMELPFTTSTETLLTADLPYIEGQFKQTSNVSDVFRGASPPHQSTLGQIQEQLSRNQGVFRPIYMQIMRSFEEIAEVAHEYFKNEEFFPTERIISIIGNNRYSAEIGGWHKIGTNSTVREVTPDEMHVDVTINALNQADALASRTFMMTSIEQIFQGIGQIPELYSDLKGKFNFGNLVEYMLSSSGHDIERLKMTEQEQQAVAKQAEEQRQRQMQEQMSIMEQQKASDNKAKIDLSSQIEQLKHQQKLEQLQVAEKIKLDADIERMIAEAELENQSGESLGHGNNINQ